VAGKEKKRGCGSRPRGEKIQTVGGDGELRWGNAQKNARWSKGRRGDTLKSSLLERENNRRG